MHRVSFALFLIVFCTGLFLSPYIGPAWDEPDNIVAGGQYVNFFLGKGALSDPSYFSKQVYTQEGSLARYPPVPNYVGSFISLLSRAHDAHAIIRAFHVATSLFFALLVSVVYLLGITFGLSHWVSLFAAICTFFYPTLFGHGLSNLKDTAQVSLFALSIYLLRKNYTARAAVVWGLALATKINAVYVPIIWFATTRSKKIGIFLVLGLIAMVVVWPYLWFRPIEHIREVAEYFVTVGQGYRIFWNGNLYQVGVGHVLWWYPWANFFLVTPLPLLVLFILGVAHELKKKRWILLVWFVLPLLRAFSPNAAFYDGIRHFMEILPAATLLAGIGLEKISHLRGVRYAGHLVIAYLIAINVIYFPYSTGYLNVLTPDPNVRFDRDIEALSVKEGVEYLHKKYGTIRLWSPIGGHLSWYYLGAGDRYVYNAPEADSIILINKSSHIRQKEFDALVQPQYRLDHEIRRGNAIFAWIYRKNN